MKKTLVRILAFALVLILALGIIPLGALAATVGVYEEYHASQTPAWEDSFFYNYVGDVSGNTVTIKASDYDKHVMMGDEFYDLKGVFDLTKLPKDLEKKIETTSSITYTKNGAASVMYVPHQHRLSYWYSDSTTHWRECLTCKRVLGHYNQFMYQNWHSDGDEDRICDVCGADIPYHEVKVIDSKGGKITVNLDEAPHRKKITATVDVEDGYKLKKLHFTKVRDDDSRQEITRRKKNGEFWTYMPTYDLEVTAEYVKKK